MLQAVQQQPDLPQPLCRLLRHLLPQEADSRKEGGGRRGKGALAEEQDGNSALADVARERKPPEGSGERGAANSAAAAGAAATACATCCASVASAVRLGRRGRGRHKERGTSRGRGW